MFHVKHQIIHSEYPIELLEEAESLTSYNTHHLKNYSEKLLWWNTKINLVSRDVSHETINEHIRHSLLLSGFVSKEEGKRVIDTGTGGGLPGLPLAICMPEKNFILNDIVSKKIIAVKQMAGTLNLKNLETISESIKNLNIEEGDIVVTKHAFKINQLIELLGNKKWNKIYFLKGRAEAGGELEGVGFPLSIEVFSLERMLKKEFYKGKAVVKVEKSRE